MEEFKVQIFKEENPNKELRYISLSSKDSKWVTINILELSGVSKSVNETPLFYTSIMKSLENEIDSKGDITSKFLKDLLTSLDITLDSICFIFWDYESRIDLFTVQDVIDHWEYVWFGSSDEAIVLYFPGNRKLIFLTDYGLIKTN